MAANVTKIVNKTTSVTYQDTFTYTISASFSGLGGSPITDAFVTDFIPDYIQVVTPPPVGGVLQSVTIVSPPPQPGGDTYRFDFGPIINTGISYSFQFTCKYKPGYVDNFYVFNNNADLHVIQGGIETITPVFNPPAVTLSVTPNFVLNKTLSIPVIDPAPGSQLIYNLTFKNIGDPGARISGVQIYDYISSIDSGFVELDSSVYPTGNDASPSPFNDTSYDQTVAIVPGQTGVTFDLSYGSPYYGTLYNMTLTALVGNTAPYLPDFPPGTTIVNTAYWGITGVTQGITEVQNPLIGATSSGSLSKYGPNTAPGVTLPVSPITPISYELYVQNTGNLNLTNFVMQDDLPVIVPTPGVTLPLVNINRIYTGVYGISSIDYSLPGNVTLTYSNDGGSTYNNLYTGSYPQGTWVNISPEISPPITNLRFSLPSFPAGVRHIYSPKIDGYISATAVNTYGVTMLTNNANMYSDENPLIDTASKDTELNGLPTLSAPNKSVANAPSPVVPGSVITYKINFNTNLSQIENVVIEDTLPTEVKFVGVTGPTKSTYYNYFATNGGVNVTMYYNLDYNSVTNKVTIDITDPTIIDQRSSIDIKFPVKVVIGATLPIKNYATIDADNNPNLPVQGNTVTTPIILTTQLISDKKVKGALDSNYSEFPSNGFTYNGGSLVYKLTLLNSGNIPFDSLEIIDILPHLYDTGVILIDTPRDSEFPVFMSDPLGISCTNPGMAASKEYSTTYNPIRFGQNNTTIGTQPPNWSTIPPYPISDTHSFRVVLSGTNGSKFNPGDIVEVDVSGIVPVGVTVGDIAWNSFAARATYNTNQYTLPIEPEKVGIEIKNSPNIGVIGNYAFHDVNNTGIYESGIDAGINNVIVNLYKHDPVTGDVLIATTTTNNDISGNPGFYKFMNLEVDLPNSQSYYLEFLPPLGFEYTIQQLVPKGSKPSPVTGKTEAITLTTASPSNMNMYAGFIDHLCNTETFGECLGLLLNQTIQDVNILKSSVGPMIINSYLDTSKVVRTIYGEPPYQVVVTGYNYYTNVNINFIINYNSGSIISTTSLYQTTLFIPMYVTDNTLTQSVEVTVSNFYIDGSRKGFYISFDLTTCVDFQQ